MLDNSKMSSDSRRDLNAQVTRAAIVVAGRKAFGQVGFAAAGLGAIAKTARVTTGALYHHFADKKALFRAVAEDLEEELLRRVAVLIARESEAKAQLRVGILETLNLATEPNVARILIHEAPSVIGGAEWREIEKRYAFGALIGILTSIQAGGTSRIRDPELTASILLGALIEAATTILLSPDKSKALADAHATMRDLVDALT